MVLCLMSIRLGGGESEAVHEATTLQILVGWVDMYCGVRSSPEEAETVRATTSKFGLGHLVSLKQGLRN